MSLKFFHIVFIIVSMLMCLVVGLWAINAYRHDGSGTWIALAALSFAGGASLVVYGTRFLQKFRRLGVAMLVLAGTLSAPADALACAVCLGNTQSSLRDGMNAGIFALLGFAGFMIVSFAVFFVYLARKAANPEVPSSTFQVPRSSTFEVPRSSTFQVPRSSRFNVPGSEGDATHA